MWMGTGCQPSKIVGCDLFCVAGLITADSADMLAAIADSNAMGSQPLAAPSIQTLAGTSRYAEALKSQKLVSMHMHICTPD